VLLVAVALGACPSRAQVALLSAREEARGLLARAAALIPPPPPPPGVVVHPPWVRCNSPPPRRRAGTPQQQPEAPVAARSAPASPQAPWSSSPVQLPEGVRARAAAMLGARRAARASEARTHAAAVSQRRDA
jgi:hypothetical protein